MVDVTVIGGGLAGLSLAIDLRKRGLSVLVIEKGEYPRHKVCGEYISMESHDYLLSICPALKTFQLPHISQFQLTTSKSRKFTTTLDLGGFGISRYLLEDCLYREAIKHGVDIKLNTKAQQVYYDATEKIYGIKVNNEVVSSTLVCNATGRKSNLKNSAAKGIRGNYVGIKYHVQLKRDANVIEIHNFQGGYCGISNIENDLSCLCYIVNSNYLKDAGNSIPALEQRSLFRNENLKDIFTNATFLFKEPVTISGINFRIKKPYEDGIFYLGDAAGSMAPIVGNGMSMALRSACVLAGLVEQYFLKKINKEQLVSQYSSLWKEEFSSRVKLSSYLQKLSESTFLTNRMMDLFSVAPSFANFLIRQTHGKPF